MDIMKFKITKNNILNNNSHDLFNYDEIICRLEETYGIDSIEINIELLKEEFIIYTSNCELALYITFELKNQENVYLINTLGDYNIDVINDIVNIIKECRND